MRAVSVIVVASLVACLTSLPSAKLFAQKERERAKAGQVSSSPRLQILKGGGGAGEARLQEHARVPRSLSLEVKKDASRANSGGVTDGTRRPF
jgi:hypothetical protein